jgi:dTDP-4-dehydrorhamnose reductase
MRTVKILLLGKNGQLGWELQRTLAPLGTIIALDVEDLDLADTDTLRQRVGEVRPELIVNASAYTDVDGAESNHGKANAINVLAPKILAEEALSLDALLVHFSTDYVFDGAKGRPYAEDDPPNPLNAYGRSKLAGEQAIQSVGGCYLIFRTAWLYSMRGSNFVTKVLAWSRQQETLRIVDDQVSNPTWARTLAQLTADILARKRSELQGRSGLYHLAGGGFASRYQWAAEILKLDPKAKEQKATRLLRAASVDMPTAAQRPLFSALNCDRFTKVFGLTVPPWNQELELALRESVH